MIPCIFFDSVFVVVLNAVRKHKRQATSAPAQSGDRTFLPGELESHKR
jgi:hypothetical protein